MKDLLKHLDASVTTRAGKVDKKDIVNAEKKLSMSFGAETKEYLITYGSISYKSVEFFGLGFSDQYYLNIVFATQELRNMGLPKGYIPIYDIGDGHYAVISNKDIVFEWTYHEKEVKRRIASRLSEYLSQALK
jgi:hypothetical protein